MIYNLCKPCAVALASGGEKVTAAHSRCEKITCASCRRRRYGIAYEVSGFIPPAPPDKLTRRINTNYSKEEPSE